MKIIYNKGTKMKNFDEIDFSKSTKEVLKEVKEVIT